MNHAQQRASQHRHLQSWLDTMVSFAPFMPLTQRLQQRNSIIVMLLLSILRPRTKVLCRRVNVRGTTMGVRMWTAGN